ncbi:hypothetical protein [Streptomyces beigongshangae]|uniref:hypothetical protein n=1 Tax=Streptomyces beigongshangae TaxID=2841597 RepID=UPI0021A2A01E|nr:hypothetical protein [Streptomyces sp. REN17]
MAALAFGAAPSQAAENSAAYPCGSSGDWSSDGGAYADFSENCLWSSGGGYYIHVTGTLHDYAKDGLGPRLYAQPLTATGWGATQLVAHNSNGYDGPPEEIAGYVNGTDYRHIARYKVCNGGVSTNCSGWFEVSDQQRTSSYDPHGEVHT